MSATSPGAGVRAPLVSVLRVNPHGRNNNSGSSRHSTEVSISNYLQGEVRESSWQLVSSQTSTKLLVGLNRFFSWILVLETGTELSEQQHAAVTAGTKREPS